MTEITTELLPWSSDDEAHWNSFLLTDTGKKLIPKFVENIPPLLTKGDINGILIRSGEVRGFQLAVSALLELTHSPPLPVKNPENYPDPEDDTKWNNQ